jgi:hypothetical protein
MHRVGYYSYTRHYLPPSRAVNEKRMRGAAYDLALWVYLAPYPSPHTLVTVKIHILVSWIEFES